MRLDLLIAWKYLGAQRKNFFVFLITLFSALGVCIGTFALVAALGVANGFEDDVITSMIGKDAHFELMLYHNEPMKEYETILSHVEKMSEVKAVTPYIVYKVGISSKKVNDGIVVYGIDAERSKKVIDLSNNMHWGEYNLDSTADTTGKKFASILLGSSLANRLRVLLGDKVVLQTFQSPEAVMMGGGAPRMAQFKVTGIFKTGMYEYDASLAYVDLASAQNLLQMEGTVSGLQGRIDDPWQSGVFCDSLVKRIKGYPYYASDWQSRNQSLLKWINIEKLIISLVLTLILLVAAFNIISSLIMAVLIKTREVGVLRAMGFSRKRVMRVFVLMGGIIGLSGSIIGVGVGVALGVLQSTYGWIKLPPDVYSISYLPIKILPSDVMLVFFGSNIVCVLATLLPAWKASKLDPVTAIRND